MFDLNLRSEVEESVGYEQYVIETCLREEEERHGTVSPLTFIFQDQNPYEIKMEIRENVRLGGSETGFPSTLSPLLFCAGFKVLDMIVEWVIRENLPQCPIQFEEKIKVLSSGSLRFPDFLDTDAQFRNVVMACYRNLVSFRNAITHRRWGANRDGNLHFDFIDKKLGRVQKVISLKEVVGWSGAMAALANLLIHPTQSSARAIDHLRAMFDQFQTLHGNPAFSVTIPRFYTVIRRTNASPFTVDIKRIRTEIEKQAQGHSYEFLLRIEVGQEGNRTIWQIPPDKAPSADFLLDGSWDTYKS